MRDRRPLLLLLHYYITTRRLDDWTTCSVEATENVMFCWDIPS
jgi:hypothetical protein